MKVAIVDDEFYALEGLRMELESMGGIEVVGLYEDGQRFLEEFGVIKPDLILMDIEMPGGNGFEVLERLMENLSDRPVSIPCVIFVTAYNQYAVQAFEVNALDYIVKPVTRERLTKAIDRCRPATQIKEKGGCLKIDCLGHFSMSVDGKVINTGWRTKKAEELIAYLLCEKGKFVSKEKIADALWPDLDGEKSVSNLYLAYYYIKKQEQTIGIRIPIESARGKMRLCIEEVDCDLIRLDQSLEQLKNVNENNLTLAEETAQRYTGMPLEDRYYPWAAELQYQYDAAYMRLVEKINTYQQERTQVKE